MSRTEHAPDQGHVADVLSRHFPHVTDSSSYPAEADLWCACQPGNDDDQPLASWAESADAPDVTALFRRVFGEHQAQALADCPPPRTTTTPQHPHEQDSGHLVTPQGRAAQAARDQRVSALTDLIATLLTDGPRPARDLIVTVDGNEQEIREAIWQLLDRGQVDLLEGRPGDLTLRQPAPPAPEVTTEHDADRS